MSENYDRKRAIKALHDMVMDHVNGQSPYVYNGDCTLGLKTSIKMFSPKDPLWSLMGKIIDTYNRTCFEPDQYGRPILVRRPVMGRVASMTIAGNSLRVDYFQEVRRGRTVLYSQYRTVDIPFGPVVASLLQ